MLANATRIQLTYEELEYLLEALELAGLTTRDRIKLIKKLAKAKAGLSPAAEAIVHSTSDKPVKQEIINKINLKLLTGEDLSAEDKEQYKEYTGIDL